MSVNFADGKFHFEDESIFEAWGAAYPRVNVKAEVRKAEAWAAANPAKAKKNWKRFLVNWLSRAQSKAPKGPATEKRAPVWCKHCGGSGIAVVDGYAYRCRCSNAEGLSQLFIKAPDGFFLRQAPPLMEWLVAYHDHEKLFKGFRSSGKLLKRMEPDKYGAVRQFFLDLFGKEKAVRLFKKTEEIPIR